MKKVCSNLWFMWKLCFKTAPGFMLYHLYDGFRLQIMIFLEHTLCIQYVLKCAEHGEDFVKEPFWSAISVVCGFLLLMMLVTIPDGYYQHAMVYRAKPKLYKALKEQMYEKAAELDLSCYDNPKYYNEFVLAVSESEASIDRFLTFLNNTVQSITILVSTGIFFILTDKVGILFVSISFVASFFLAKKLNKLNYDVRMKVNPWERKRNYASRVFYLNDYAKELRLNKDVAKILKEDFEEANEAIVTEQKAVAKKRIGLSFARFYCAGDFITDGLYVAYLIFMAAVWKLIDYSNAVVLFNQTGRLRRGMRGIAEIAPAANENSLYIEKIRSFLAYEPEMKQGVGEEVPEGTGVLELKNVSFRYTEESEEILHNISLKVEPGERVAIVGYNGAGKTTLIKLLMRLYDPSAGEVSYHGKDIKDYVISDYRNRVGVVFQDFKMFGATLLENVVLEDVGDGKAEETAVTEALCKSGFGDRIETLPNGLATGLTTEFDEKGVNLSGGESQKVAIARAFYRNADILIMDEPSSALDPIAEYNLNKAMHEAAEGKTVFYISHRLSTTRDADRILMLEKGRIIEEGTHEELLAKNGQYAEMWYAQAGKYTA